MSYRLEVEPLADKQAQPLDRKTLKRLQKRMEELARTPYDPRLSKPLTMSRDRRSSRVGDWRITYYLYYLDQPRAPWSSPPSATGTRRMSIYKEIVYET